MNKIEIHLAENVKTGDQPMIIVSFGIIGPNAELDHGIGLPVYRVTGNYDELRAALHRDVDRVFDAHLNTGEFTTKLDTD